MSDRLPPTSLYPTIIRALAITAIVLGSLGALIAAYGLLNVFLMSAGVFSPQPPPNLPAAMRESFLELMEVQRGVAWYAVFPTALSGLVSLFMVIAGVQSLQQKEDMGEVLHVIDFDRDGTLDLFAGGGGYMFWSKNSCGTFETLIISDPDGSDGVDPFWKGFGRIWRSATYSKNTYAIVDFLISLDYQLEDIHIHGLAN